MYNEFMNVTPRVWKFLTALSFQLPIVTFFILMSVVRDESGDLIFGGLLSQILILDIPLIVGCSVVVRRWQKNNPRSNLWAVLASVATSLVLCVFHIWYILVNTP